MCTFLVMRLYLNLSLRNVCTMIQPVSAILSSGRPITHMGRVGLSHAWGRKMAVSAHSTTSEMPDDNTQTHTCICELNNVPRFLTCVIPKLFIPMVGALKFKRFCPLMNFCYCIRANRSRHATKISRLLIRTCLREYLSIWVVCLQ